MKTVLIIISFLSFVITSTGQSTLVDDRYQMITGFVEDENGDGINGVMVQFNHALYGLARGVSTNPKGQFIFENIGREIDFGAPYEFSFRKAGYSPLNISRLLNDPRRVTLKKSRSGYILIKNTTGALRDIKAGANDLAVRCSQSDQFGYIRIEIPFSYQNDKPISITVLGDGIYFDKTITTNADALSREIIELVLEPMGYRQLKFKLDDLIIRIRDNSEEQSENEFIRIFNYLDGVKLSKKDKEEWQVKRLGYLKIYDFLIASIKTLDEVKIRNALKVDYDLLWEQVEETKTFESRMEGLTKIFNLSLQILDKDLIVYQDLGISTYFLEDAQFLSEFLGDEFKFIEKHSGEITDEYKKECLQNLERKFNLLERRKMKFEKLSSQK